VPEKGLGMIKSVTGEGWITKATNIHLEYVIPIASSRQQWLHEHVS